MKSWEHKTWAQLRYSHALSVTQKKRNNLYSFLAQKKKKKDKNQSIGNKCQVLVANRSSQLSLTRQFWGVTWLGFYHLASPRCYLAPKTAVSFCEPPHFLTTPFFWKKLTRVSVPFVVKNAGWQNSDWRLRRGVAGTGGRETIPSCGTTFSYPCDEGRHTCQNHLLKGCNKVSFSVFLYFEWFFPFQGTAVWMQFKG